jgi:hypothetical protein
VVATTHVIDLASGQEREVETGGAWLPAVDPTNRHAIAWRGDLSVSAREVLPERGALYALDWQALDPFADGTADPTDPAPDRGTTPPTEQPRDGGSPRRGERRGGGNGPTAGAVFVPALPLPSAEPEATDGRRTTPDGATDAPREASERPAEGTESDRPSEGGTDGRPTDEPATGPRRDEALEPSRDVDAEPVRDWRIGWSDDGSAFGFWVTGTPGETWGALTVYRIGDRGVDREKAILDGVLARRAFSMGHERIAWVGPSDEQADGELRLSTWGSRGYGTLRIGDVDVSSGQPAF